MYDKRYRELAELLVHYSCRVEPGENVLIEQHGYEDALSKELVRVVAEAGGRPQMRVWSEELERAWIKYAGQEALQLAGKADSALMAQMQAYIGIRQKNNLYGMGDVSEKENYNHTMDYYRPVHFEHRIPHTKWVVMCYPNDSMAQLAEMPTDLFEDFYFKVCNFDYERLSRAMTPLKELLDRADRVDVVGKEVDLHFSVKKIGAVKCDGTMNIPDGEVYTAPVKASVEGAITFNTPSPHNGQVFDRVHLELSQGKIVKSGCAGEGASTIEAILNTDPGARYIGEFAFGLHPFIEKPMKDTLFDEKITGSFHFTPGCAYDDAFNGNKSAIHWDMVYIMRPEYGGCEIRVDGELIQKDGRFVKKELLGLNPEHFKE